MFKQIRILLAEDLKLDGSSVEVDEMYHGDKRKSGRGRPMVGDKVKTLVLGMVERGGNVVALAIVDDSNDFRDTGSILEAVSGEGMCGSLSVRLRIIS